MVIELNPLLTVVAGRRRCARARADGRVVVARRLDLLLRARDGMLECKVNR